MFKRALIYTKNPSQDFITQTGTAECLKCNQHLPIENIADIYSHLFDNHRGDFVKCLLPCGDDDCVKNMDISRIKFVKEEVKDLSYINHNLARKLDSLDHYTKVKMIKIVRDLHQNRSSSKLMVDNNVFDKFVQVVEQFLQIRITLT